MSKSLPKLNTFLKFHDEQYELKFNRSRRSFQLHCFRILCLTLITLSFSIFISNPLKSIDLYDRVYAIPFATSISGVIFIYFLISRKFPNHADITIQALVASFTVASCELSKAFLHKEDWTPNIFLLLGVNLQTGSLFLIIARIKWMQSVVIIVLTQSYIWVRLLDDMHGANAILPGYITFGVYLILLPLMAYSGEKEDKKVFLDVQSYEEHLEEFENLMKNVIPSSIVVMSNDQIPFFNEKFKEMFEVNDNSDLKRILENVLIPKSSNSKLKDIFKVESGDSMSLYDFATLWQNNAGKLTAKEKFISLEGNLTLSEGQAEKSYSVQVGSTLWAGRTSIMIIINDISNIKNYYKNLGIYKDQLLATVSHELRTPLNAILGMLELALEEVKDRSIKDKLEVVMTSAKLLLNMINDILDFSLISKGKLRLSYEDVSLSGLLKDITNLLSIQARLKGLAFNIEYHLPDPESIFIRTDSNRLRQVLLNIVGNAIKFTQKGSVIIRIRGEFQEYDHSPSPSSYLQSDLDIFVRVPLAQQPFILFEIEDTGIGIREDHLPNLFRLFGIVEQSEKSLNRNGVGLGLALSQSLVKALNKNKPGGEIKVKSVLGMGSVFYFPIFEKGKELNKVSCERREFTTIPVLDVKKNKMPNSYPKEMTPSCFKKKIKVLAVDDDQINLLVIKNYLTSNDFRLDTASNGHEAIQLVEKKAEQNDYFDIFLMDCNMPVMDGYEASRILKARMNVGELKIAPIIAATANVASSDKEKCLENGMDHFLTKPFRKTDLVLKIQEALEVSKE